MLKLAIGSTLVVCILAPSAAQGPPDLSGTWIATTEAPKGVEAAPSPVFGARFGIKQDAGTVTLTRIGRDGAFPLTLALDGTELRWRVPGQVCQGDSERTEKVGFEGPELVYTLVGMTPPGAASRECRTSGTGFARKVRTLSSCRGRWSSRGRGEPVATLYKRSGETLPAAAPAVSLPKVTTAPATIAQAAWIAGTWIGTSGTRLRRKSAGLRRRQARCWRSDAR